ncbi:MAG: cation transporter [Calditrichaeota bacterium]|nr:cation transporter [Calditrichota bacterium]
MFNKLTKFIVKKVIKNYHQSDNDDVRSRYGFLEAWTSIWLNFFIFIVKVVFGFMTQSIALIADAFHTLSDISTSIIILIGFRISRKPPDKEHPFGHGRMEAIATLIIATLLLVTGIELGKSAFMRILHPRPIHASWIVIGIIFITVLLKEALAQFSRQLGKMIQSGALEADYWHHHTDAIAAILVIIAMVLGKFNFPYLDGYAGVLVSIIIIFMGFRIAKQSSDCLLGASPDPEIISKIKKIVQSFNEVLNVYDIVVHQYGQMKIATLHIEISDAYSLQQAHELVEKIEDEVKKQLNIPLSIHTDPINLRDKHIQAVRDFLDAYIRSHDLILSYNDIWIKNTNNEKHLIFDIVLRTPLQEEKIEALKSDLKKIISEKFPSIASITINIDPTYMFR